MNKIESWDYLKYILENNKKKIGSVKSDIKYVGSTKKDIEEEIDLYERLINRNKDKEKLLLLIKLKRHTKNDCSICYDKIINIQFEIPGCKHVFHNSCIQNLFFIYNKNRCPLCRREFYFHSIPSKKQKIKLKKRIMKHISNDDGNVIPLRTISNLHIFICLNSCWIPNWLDRVMNGMSRWNWSNFKRINNYSMDNVSVMIDNDCVDVIDLNDDDNPRFYSFSISPRCIVEN